MEITLTNAEIVMHERVSRIHAQRSLEIPGRLLILMNPLTCQP